MSQTPPLLLSFINETMNESNENKSTDAHWPQDFAQGACIRVIGVGGGGGNAVAHMIKSGLKGVDCICTNTDTQALQKIVDLTDSSVYQLGLNVTRGLGAGANPEQGKRAAESDRDAIHQMLLGADMVFITAGMGGGTGTGAAPVIARIAKDLGILTVAVVTRPFGFEGKKRSAIADAGVEALLAEVDSIITIPNEKLLTALSRKITLTNAFDEANNVLLNAVQGISELITSPGMINLDFADITTVMKETGISMMGIGESFGEQRASKAAVMAINSPLLEDINLANAAGILINITANEELTLSELSEVSGFIDGLASDETHVIIGTAIDPAMEDRLRVTVVATGLERKAANEKVAKPIQAKKEKVEPSYRSWSKSESIIAMELPESKADTREVSYDHPMIKFDIPTFLRKHAGA